MLVQKPTTVPCQLGLSHALHDVHILLSSGLWSFKLVGRKFARFYTIFFKGKFCQYFFNWHSVVLITWNWPWKFHFNLKSYLSAQWAKGYCFDQKISKYFFLLHCDKKFQKWFFYPSLHFSRGEFFFFNFQFFLYRYSKTQ